MCPDPDIYSTCNVHNNEYIVETSVMIFAILINYQLFHFVYGIR